LLNDKIRAGFEPFRWCGTTERWQTFIVNEASRWNDGLSDQDFSKGELLNTRCDVDPT
jgi:hypothetical protein